MELLLVMTQVPNQECAQRIAQCLLKNHFAACVNILAPCHSFYHWQGALESNEEIPLIIKTTQQRYAQVETTIREYHPYELPEIVALQITQGLPAYLRWVLDSTQRGETRYV